MSILIKASLTFIPLLSILSLSPMELEKGASRSIASVGPSKSRPAEKKIKSDKKDESLAHYEKAAAKIDDKKILVPDDMNFDKYKVKTFDLREALGKVEKELAPGQKESKELQELIPKIIAAEKELKKLKDNNRLKDSEKKSSDNDLKSLKLMANSIIGKLDGEEKKPVVKAAEPKKVVFLDRPEDKKEQADLSSEVEKKEDEKFTFEITKIEKEEPKEEPKKDICTVDHNKAISDQMNQLTALVANLANTVAQNSQLMTQFLMSQQTLPQYRPNYASPNTNWVYMPQQPQTQQAQQPSDYSHSPQMAFNPQWQLAQQYSFDPRFSMNQVTPGPFGNAPFMYNFSQGQNNFQAPLAATAQAPSYMPTGTLGSASYQGQTSTFNVPLTNFF